MIVASQTDLLGRDKMVDKECKMMGTLDERKIANNKRLVERIQMMVASDIWSVANHSRM